ncbi:MAG: DNA mismatch repair endonuclease MutL, partial [Fusobacteriaceae bacterium]
MGIIKILDESVSNIIAAGEVVENPTAMLKELLENSLDAESTQIRIEVKKGGRELLISDNGKGMGREDLLICVERHATSKISKKEDLFNLASYGFRGEALASICAVSKVRVTSKTEESLLGNSITVSAGKITSL